MGSCFLSLFLFYTKEFFSYQLCILQFSWFRLPIVGGFHSKKIGLIIRFIFHRKKNVLFIIKKINVNMFYSKFNFFSKSNLLYFCLCLLVRNLGQYPALSLTAFVCISETQFIPHHPITSAANNSDIIIVSLEASVCQS